MPFRISILERIFMSQLIPDPNFLPPTLDIVFKRLFSAKENERLLISLLTAVLVPESPIEEVEVLNPALPEDWVTCKSIVMDIFLRLKDGREVNIEMQANNVAHFTSRMLFYWARAISSQLGKGGEEPYGRLKPVNCISFLNFILFPAPEVPYHTQFVIMEEELKFKYTDLLKMHFIELPKLKKASVKEKRAPSEESLLDLWSEFLSCKTRLEMEVVAMKHPILNEAQNAVINFSASDQNRYDALAREKGLRDYNSRFYEGMEEGILKGKAEGKTEGKREAKLEMARELLAEGDDLTRVSKITGLSEEELQKLLS
jgi:predicted transposase/invertase (TIGR01784 family)